MTEANTHARVPNAFRLEAHDVLIDGLSLCELADQVGTPLYVYSSASMRARYAALRSALSPRFGIFYAVKANPHVAVCARFAELGAGAEVASGPELEIALAAGFPPERIILNGPGKSDDEIQLALSHSIAFLNVESVGEIDRVERLASRHGSHARLCLRLSVDHALRSAKMSTVGAGTRFGMSCEDARRALQELAKTEACQFAGFHVYFGSQIMEAADLLDGVGQFLRAVQALCEECGVTPRFLDFGGGLGVPYAGDDPEFDLASLAHGLSEQTDGLFEEAQLLLEPGRFLVAESGVYVARVVETKTLGGRRFAILDGGINHAFLPITINKLYPTLAINRPVCQDREEVTLGGPLCTSIDQFSRTLSLPPLRPGDRIGIFDSGAYGYSCSLLGFLSRPTPAEVLIHQGRAEQIRKKGSAADVLRGQIDPFP